MVSPASRRRAVTFLVERGYSRIRSCRIIGISRVASRNEPKERNPSLVKVILELSEKRPRFGFRRIFDMLEGVNIKAVRRIWKREGLTLRRMPRRRLRVDRLQTVRAAYPNQTWAMDFCHERLENGRHVRILGVIDSFTRELLTLRAAPSFPSFEVRRELDWLFLLHGKPQSLLSDNGPEFRALETPIGIEKRFIQPGKPWQNGQIESFFGKLRDELLNCELFTCLSELQTALEQFQDDYNRHRPHSALKGKSPSRFHEEWRKNNQMQEPILTLCPGQLMGT